MCRYVALIRTVFSIVYSIFRDYLAAQELKVDLEQRYAFYMFILQVSDNAARGMYMNSL